MEVEGEQVFVEKKKIKNLYLKISRPDGTIRMSVPAKVRDEEIRSLIRDRKDWIFEARQKVRDLGDTIPRDKEQKEEYRKKLMEMLPGTIEKCEKITGVHAREWKIRDMKTRWGSCNVEKKRIWLNLQLAAYPEECLEYVVIHELTHLLERGHNSVFWGYMDQFFPDWRRVRKILR